MKFDELKYRTKCLLLCGGFLLFLLIAGKFSFSDTIHIMARVNENKLKISWLLEKEKEIPMLNARIKAFDKLYTRGDSLAARDKLTAWISAFAEKNNCLVTEIPSAQSFSSEHVNVYTNVYTVKGTFHPLLQLLNGLEQDCRYITKVMSSRFFTLKDHQTRKKQLYLTVVTQSFQQK